MSAVPPAGTPDTVPATPVRRRSRAGLVLRLVAAVLVLALLVFIFAQIFTGCLIPLPTNMDDQPSFGYVEPPRDEPPGEAVPFGEPHEIASLGTPANPVSFSEDSQARGQAQYAVFCVICHGEPGAGEPGQVGELYEPPPPDLADSAGRLSDGQMYQIITAGIGRMPALAGRMAPLQRWDAVNYLRSFSPAERPPAAAAQNAARNYSIQCSQCHGSSAEGALGTPLYPSSFLTEGSVEEISRFIQVGRRQRGMPPFAGRMSDEEIGQLADFLKDLQQEGPGLLRSSLAELDGSGTTTTTAGQQTTTTMAPQATTTTAPPEGTTTTGADQAVLDQGLRVYDANCQGCHGPEGAGGGIGPPLNPNDFVARSPEEAVREVIENGRTGTAMPPFEGRLSPEEIDAVTALLRSWSPPSAQGFTDVALAEEEASEELPFSHRAHVQRGMQCIFCHSGAVRGPSAGLPSLELCAGCHRFISTQNENTQQVVAAFDEGRSVSWPRIYDQPDFVYFSHRPHVAVAGLSCSTCHGEVGEMTLARKVRDLHMGFCLDCHQQQNYVYAEEGEAQFTEGYLDEERPPTGRFLTDCHICHK